MDAEDNIPVDREDSSLTPEQAELMAKLEGLFQELPLARQRAMLRKLRAADSHGEGPDPMVDPARADTAG